MGISDSSLNLEALDQLHDYVFEVGDDPMGLLDEVDLDELIGYGDVIEALAGETPEPDDECIEIDMNVVFEDGVEVRIVVQAPDNIYALSALRQAGGTEYLKSLAESLEGNE